MRGVIIILFGLLFISGCSPKCRDGAGIPTGSVSVQIDRLEGQFFDAASAKEVEEVFKNNRGFARLFLHSDQYPADSILADQVFNLISQPAIDSLYLETMTAFPDLVAFQSEMGEALFRANFIFPQVGNPRFVTTVTGLYNDLYISDTLVVVGLDYFIGAEATYKPVDIPAYILKRYNEAHLPATIIKFLIGPHIEKGKSETMLSEMIDFGKNFYIQSRILPCTPDSILLGYTTENMRVIEENEAIIWANFVENEILYETNHFVKRKFLGERPNVYEINADCPGRIGTWIGWRIVESYVENNSVTLQELAADRDHEKIFQLSRYKPK